MQIDLLSIWKWKNREEVAGGEGCATYHDDAGGSVVLHDFLSHFDARRLVDGVVVEVFRRRVISDDFETFADRSRLDLNESDFAHRRHVKTLMEQGNGIDHFSLGLFTGFRPQ